MKNNHTNQKNYTNKEFLNCPLKKPTEEKVKLLKEIKRLHGTITKDVVSQLKSEEMKNNNGKLAEITVIPDLESCVTKNHN